MKSIGKMQMKKSIAVSSIRASSFG